MRRFIRALATIAMTGGVAGCAQSACVQPDVLAFVDQASQARDLDGLGVSAAPVQESRLPAQRPGRRFNRRTELCQAWMLSRNPAWQPGTGQPRFVRVPQGYWVSKLQNGYEVGLLGPGLLGPGPIRR